MLVGYDFEDPCNSISKSNDPPKGQKAGSNLGKITQSGRKNSPLKQNSLGFMSKIEENGQYSDDND